MYVLRFVKGLNVRNFSNPLISSCYHKYFTHSDLTHFYECEFKGCIFGHFYLLSTNAFPKLFLLAYRSSPHTSKSKYLSVPPSTTQVAPFVLQNFSCLLIGSISTVRHLALH
jgi:hypothetical protein